MSIIVALPGFEGNCGEFGSALVNFREIIAQLKK
jgi:hypothetical protein